MTEQPLYSFQLAAALHATAGHPLYVGFDPGLGKSRTALEAAKRRNAKRLLIICPASGRYVWEREVAKWWPGHRVSVIMGPQHLSYLQNLGVVILTYGLISQRDSPFASVIAKGQPFDMTVLDEAAALKNSGANRTRVILGKMLLKLGYVLPMSGTPAPNHAGELYPILKALYPSAIMNGSGKPLAEWEFQDQYCHVVRKRFGTGREVRVIEGSRNLPLLRQKIGPFMLRVKKEDVLYDLPPIRWDVVPVQPSAPVSGPMLPTHFSDDDLLKYLSGATGDEHIMKLRRMLGLAKTAPAIDYIDEFMADLPGNRKLLVFAHHKEVITALRNGLADWNPVVITGETPPALRTIAVDNFLGNHSRRVFIGNIAAAGTGLTLVGPKCACSDVVFVEASYSAMDNVQAACRVHRIGQREAVVARFLTARGTIDDRIQSILARKAKDFDSLFN